MTSGRFLSGGGLELSMLPSDHQHEPHPPPTSKRKADDVQGNPFAAAAKRTKKEGKTSNKRKLLNGEEVTGGLMIVRAPPTRPPSSQSQSQPGQNIERLTEPTRPPSRPPSAQADRPPSRPPSSQSNRPPTSQPQRPPSAAGHASQPPAKKFRADASSRTVSKSKDRELPQPSDAAIHDDQQRLDEDVRQMESEANSLRQQSRLLADTSTATTSSSSSALNPAFQFPPPPPASVKKQKYAELIQRVPEQETPQNERSRAMRSGESSGSGSGHRRKSSLSRGKRISSSYGATGVISQPHKSVSDNSLYKHIDCDLPESLRARQLLIWCTSRAPVHSSSKPRRALDGGTDPPLPELTPEEAAVVDGVKEDLMRLLAEGRVRTSVVGAGGPEAPARARGKGKMKENEQNVKNRAREIRFNEQIARARAEAEAWSEATHFYDAYTRGIEADMEREQQQYATGTSAQVKGKQRAVDGEAQLPRVDELPERFRGAEAVEAARKVLGLAEEDEEERRLQQRLSDLPYKLDRIHAFANSALQTTRVIEADLDYRFSLLTLSLTAPHEAAPPHAPSSSALPALLAPAPTRAGDAQGLLRALTRIDAARPQSAAALRVVRGVQRAEGAERRLTGVVPPTPRRAGSAPPTPRRAGTPGRGGEQR